MFVCLSVQGPPDRFDTVNQLLNSIPRDGDYDSELWTTVDKDKTNVRQKAKSKLVKGFSIYMVFMGKNFPYDGKTESRYRDLLIVCNVQPSSGPVDMESLLKQAADYKRLIVSEEAAEIARHYQNNPQAAAADAQALLMVGGGNGAAAAGQEEQDPIRMLEDEMDIDLHLLRKGVVQKNRNIKGKNKGPRYFL